MALEIKWGRSPFWYGRFIREGKKTYVKLNVPIEGTPPPSRRLKDRGDAAFEKSRMKAEIGLESVIKEMESQLGEEQLLRRIHTLRTGRRFSSVELDKMYEHFAELPRKEEISESNLDQSRSRLEKFVAFVRKKNPKARYMTDVDALDAADFMASEAKRGVSPKTHNDGLIFLRGVFERLKTRAGMVENPFSDIPLKIITEIGRDPFSLDDLKVILTVIEKPEHAFIRPVIKGGICTSMRRGDCCRLAWADVDLEAGFIEVVTAKKGVKATIPLLPMLAAEIRKCLPQRGPYVFDEQRQMYEKNPDGISDRVKLVLKDAGFFDTDDVSDSPPVEGHRGNVTAKRTVGLRVASIRGFHSFRVTWATHALLAGVPVELVQKITGHKTVHVLLNNYFKPGREEIRRVLQEKMPKLLSPGVVAGSSETPPAQSIREKLKAMTADNWPQIRDEVLAMLSRSAA